MSRKTIVLLIILSLVLFLVFSNRKDGKLVIPGFTQQAKVTEVLPTPASPVTPKTFKFDRSTDLKKELEQVNPEVLNSDL